MIRDKFNRLAASAFDLLLVTVLEGNRKEWTRLPYEEARPRVLKALNIIAHHGERYPLIAVHYAGQLVMAGYPKKQFCKEEAITLILRHGEAAARIDRGKTEEAIRNAAIFAQDPWLEGHLGLLFKRLYPELIPGPWGYRPEQVDAQFAAYRPTLLGRVRKHHYRISRRFAKPDPDEITIGNWSPPQDLDPV